MAQEALDQAAVARGAEELGLAGQVVCIHVSLRSFPRLAEGPATFLDGLLSTGTTLLVPTMANEAFAIPAPPDDRPERNGVDYEATDAAVALAPWPGQSDIYDHTRTEVDSWLGATPAYVASRPDRVRCRRSIGEFAALGPLADDLIAAVVDEDVFGPLRAVMAHSGWVLLAGVGLTSMTLLHLAETVAGRRAFIRWARGPDGRPARSRAGECSKGFDNLAAALATVERRTKVGQSLWRAFPVAEALQLAADAIRAHPEITHCPDPGCPECADAIAGGPIEPVRDRT